MKRHTVLSRLAISAAVLSLLGTSFTAATHARTSPGHHNAGRKNAAKQHVPNTLVLRLSNNCDKAAVASALQEVHSRVKQTIRVGDSMTLLVVKTPKGKLTQIAKSLSANKNFSYITTDQYCKPLSAGPPVPANPSDRFYKDQWGLMMMKHPKARMLPVGPRTAMYMYFLDSGLNPLNVEIPRMIQYNCTVEGTPVREHPHDVAFHGTSIVAVAAATTNNGLGIAGVVNLGKRKNDNGCVVTMLRVEPDPVPEETVTPVVEGGDEGDDWTEDEPIEEEFSVAHHFYNALAFLANKPDLVPGPVNVSWGSTTDFNADPIFQELAGLLRRRGCLVILSAGDDGEYQPSAEANCRRVTAIDSNGKLAEDANTGPFVMAAPGSAISSYGEDGKVAQFDGTSYSAAFYSGAVALTQSYLPRAVATAERADRIVQRTSLRKGGLRIPDLEQALVRASNVPPPKKRK
jgi:hypothetical protein